MHITRKITCDYKQLFFKRITKFTPYLINKIIQQNRCICSVANEIWRYGV